MKSTLQSENFLKLISKHLPDMLWAKDLDGNYLYANESICENLLMTSSDEVIWKGDESRDHRSRCRLNLVF